jgi:hypothetical protein
MAVTSGPNFVRNGLILNLDVASRRTFIESGANQASLINTANWTVGTGGVTGFANNATVASESQRLVDTDPWGNNTIVWGSYPSGDGNNDGGWEGSYFNIDRTKTYRSSVWVRRTSSTSGGTYYHGLHTNGTGDTYHLLDGASQTNPYWDYRATGGLTQNQWYLNVGFIRPYGYTGTTAHPDSGFWTITGGKTASNAGNVYADVKFPSDATQAYQRVYHFYCGDSTTRLQWAYPRWDLVDGTEPSIQELLTRSPNILYDRSGYNNHHYISGYYIPYTTGPKKLTLDGSTQGFVRNSALNGVSSNCTVVLWYSTTDTQELWVRGNQNNTYYLSASASNNYYHSNCGTPTNYVDLATVVRPDSPTNYRNGSYHMWEAKGVDFSTWTSFDWFLYPSAWQMAGNISKILVYNRSITATESAQNYTAFRNRFGI